MNRPDLLILVSMAYVWIALAARASAEPEYDLVRMVINKWN